MAPKKGASSGNKNSSKQSTVVPDSDHIVFSNSKDDKKKKEAATAVVGPPRPDVKKVIGGASWTGKLPVALLSEHCQRQKWNKPDYGYRPLPPGPDGQPKYRSWVTLSKSDPRTREMTRIAPFNLPPSHASLGDEATKLEAQHFAAAYALYRVSSMKNLAMALPPKYRDLWKGDFQRIKEEDTKEGKAWKYDADPFAAELKRQDIKASMEMREQEKAKQPPKIDNLSLVSSSSESGLKKAWERAQRMELGQNVRFRIESLIRTRSDWNQNELRISPTLRSAITKDLVASGFRPIHVEEAMEHCGSREEVLEWLLIHVPEDSLPPWSFPAKYTAGVSLASSDPGTDSKIKRLTKSGYSTQLCIEALRANGNHEGLALEALQSRLIPQTTEIQEQNSDHDLWSDEMTALEAILAERFSSNDAQSCTIKSTSGLNDPVEFYFRIPTTGYPKSNSPIFSIDAPKLPAYVRLSVVRKAAIHARESLLGDQMIYSLLEWLETSLPEIIERPGPLSDLEIRSISLSVKDSASSISFDNNNPRGIRSSDKGFRKDFRTGKAVYDAWDVRQKTPSQKKMLSARQQLPAWTKQDEIVSVVQSHQVTLITGETGSGKSTQAIQFVLDDAIRALKGSSANLLCTQPRRVAALSLSERVSAERCSDEGDEVGYTIRGDSKVSPRTKITFMTTGVLLRRLQSSANIQSAVANVSHIFVDEVHERNLDTDFLLALLKDALLAVPNLKIVLMSATIDADVFSGYFGGKQVGRVHIEGRTFPVRDLYLDDVVRMTSNMKGRQASWDNYEEDPAPLEIGKAIQSLGVGIPYNLIASLVTQIDSLLGSASGGILIFLPGTLEIDRCLRSLSSLPQIHALPLHASLLPSEQRLVFRPPPQGKRKVVAATNVAETSITIEDIVAVIDTGKVKETTYDATTNIVRLAETWASLAACKQRRGRAGRVRAGTCYKLFTRNIESQMAAATPPEIHRVPLEQLCLSVKATGSDQNVQDFLSRTISPPDSRAVASALRTLERMGALEDDRLTGLGVYLSMIPADLRCAKLLVHGVLFDCVETSLTIAAILTTKSPFVSPREKREEAKEARASFGTSDGDLLLDAEAFSQWKSVTPGMRYGEISTWCNTRFLSPSTLRDIDSTRSQLLGSLIETSLLPPDYTSASQSHNNNSTNKLLLRALVASALNPNVAEIKMPDKKYIASMSGAKELDPEAKTIKYFTEDGRVFVHPSSVLFDAQGFTGNAGFVSYFGKMATSKNFVRELTPVSMYGILLFGGQLVVDERGLGVTVDGWCRFRGWARIGVLVSRLRRLLDSELRRRIEGHTAGADGGNREVMDVVRHLVELNGQDM